MADLIERDALEPFYESGTDPNDTYADMTFIRAEHIENAPAVNRWIPCSERMPEEETDVIAVIDGCSREAFYSDSSFIGSNFYRNAEEVTYWMPKPEPPEKE